jgi:hypothetical protein
MGLDDNLGVNARPSAWLNDTSAGPLALNNKAVSNFGQAFSQAWPLASRTPQLGPPELSALTPAAPALPTTPAEPLAPVIVRTVAAGDTLSALVRAQAQAQGVQLSGPQLMRLVQSVAKDNHISNVNRIFPGQQLNLSGLAAGLDASPRMPLTGEALLSKTAPAANPWPAFRQISASVSANPSSTATAVQGKNPLPRHEVLEKTLSRAVAKGFIPAEEKNDVRDKILELAKTHRFNPDDFARMTLMESDGMNPRASNQRCHGIIQFCDGSDRGAASAGYAANPKAILGLSVYQQLQLVDKYFDDVGLKNKGAAGLDDLYLSVLMPSARSEVRSDAPLSVGNNQAKALYEGRDTSAPMTRQSILQGLLKNAADRLGQTAAVAGRLQSIRTAAYEDNIPQPQPPTSRLR